MANEPISTRQPLIRTGFIVTLFALFAVVVLGMIWVHGNIGRGSGAESPNGKYMVRTWHVKRTLSVFLSRKGKEQPIRELTINSVQFASKIHWSDDSTYAEIMLNNQKAVRVYVPTE